MSNIYDSSFNVEELSDLSFPKVVVYFDDGTKISGSFKKISLEEEKVLINLNIGFKTRPIFYFGIKPKRVIINTGIENINIEADFSIFSIEKIGTSVNYKMIIGAPSETFTRIKS